jgi:predicted RNA-binding Zn ribbon-like protein
MRDVTASVEDFTWWLKTVGLSGSERVDAGDVALGQGFREVCVRVLDHMQAGEQQDHADLAFLNTILFGQREWTEVEQLASGRIVRHGRRSNETVMQALGPVAYSLSETLIQGDPARIRTCAHPDCVLRFYDDSKNGSRRWCSMSHCGNRAKAAAFQERRRSKH